MFYFRERIKTVDRTQIRRTKRRKYQIEKASYTRPTSLYYVLKFHLPGLSRYRFVDPLLDKIQIVGYKKGEGG